MPKEPKAKPGRRRTDPPGAIVQVDGKTLIEALRNYLTSGGSVAKLAIAGAAIIVAVWGAFSFDDRLTLQDARLDAVTENVTILETEMEQVRDDLDELKDGIASAADDLERINTLLRDLQRIRKDLIRIVNANGGR